MKRKIKVGDRVRIIENSWTDLFNVGDIVYVVGETDSDLLSGCTFYLSPNKNCTSHTEKYAPYDYKYVLVGDKVVVGGKLI